MSVLCSNEYLNNMKKNYNSNDQDQINLKEKYNELIKYDKLNKYDELTEIIISNGNTTSNETDKFNKFKSENEKENEKDTEKDTETEFDKEIEPQDINELIDILSKKINNIELISETLINSIYDTLKFIQINHNKKILNWYNDKYYKDLEEFKTNNNYFIDLMKIHETNSFVIVENE